jgi:DNA-binding NarL/FixJ family response regulator
MKQDPRILIVEDHPLVSDGIASLVQSLVPMASIEQSPSCEPALALCREGAFDHIFLDLRLPDVVGFSALEAFRLLLPGTPIAIISGEDDDDTVMQCLQLGARAFIPKSVNAATLKNALEQVLQGGMYAPDHAIDGLADVARIASGKVVKNPWGLTARHLEVATLLVDGMPNKLIADRLAIAESTVKLHVSAILRLMRVTNRSQAILLLAKSGLKLPV